MDHPKEKEEALICEEQGARDAKNYKYCTDCKTTKTPLWRCGPSGPKSLCNACGIRYRKKRRALMGLSKGPDRKREGLNTPAAAATTASTSINRADKHNGGGWSKSWKIEVMALGKEVVLQSSRVVKKKQRCQRRRRKLGVEEEEAAFSLMALSCGCVFA